MNYKERKEKENENKQCVLAVNPKVPEASGIYIFNRVDENGIKWCYVGQAKNLLQRLAQHLDGYQHIDLSIKKRGLWSKDNPCGWRIWFEYCHIEDLDEREKDWIRKCAFKGYQLYNHTLGGQGEGKRTLGEAKSPKGYYDGLQQGYKNAQKFVANLFDKHLEYSQKSKKPNKNQEKAMAKFKEFLEWSEDNGGN